MMVGCILSDPTVCHGSGAAGPMVWTFIVLTAAVCAGILESWYQYLRGDRDGE